MNKKVGLSKSQKHLTFQNQNRKLSSHSQINSREKRKMFQSQLYCNNHLIVQEKQFTVKKKAGGV